MLSIGKLRLAVYGFVGEHFGSLCSSNYIVLLELLRSGHTIDLIGIDGFQDSAGLDDQPGFSFIPVKHKVANQIWRLIDCIPSLWLRRLISPVFAQFSNRLHYGAIRKIVAERHANVPYDVHLFLGLLPQWQVKGLANFAWSQGCPLGESDWLKKNRDKLFRFGAWHLIPMLTIGYWWKHKEARSGLRFSDKIACESRWTCSCWQKLGVPAERLIAIPYAVDLKRFSSLSGQPETRKEFRFLHLGRVVPRKRFDLLIKAFEVVASEDADVSLHVVGRFSYGGSGYRKLMMGSRFSNRIHYTESMPRQAVPSAIRDSDAIVQPSENENFGSACAEAAAMGKPSLVGPTNGTRDYLPNATFLFDEYSVPAVASGMRSIMEAVRSERASIGNRCRQDAENNLSPGRVADLLLTSIRETILEHKNALDQNLALVKGSSE